MHGRHLNACAREEDGMSELERLKALCCPVDCECDLPNESCILIWAASRIEKLQITCSIVKEALRVLGEDGWSDAPYLSRLLRSVLEPIPVRKTG